MKLNYKRTFLIGLAFFSISAFWYMYDNIIPLILSNTFHMKETITGVIMAADNVLAIFLLPVFGALSDKTEGRYGKRMPFIVGGTLLAVIFLLLLPVADARENLLLFILALFALLISMGIYRSPAVALMPDLTPNILRSKGNAIINLMGAVGGVLTLVLIKTLVGKGERPDYFPLFLALALIMAVSVVILFLTINEKKVKERVNREILAYEEESGEKLLFSESEETPEEKGGKLAPEVKKSMFFLLTSIFLWYMAYNAVTTAFSRYSKVVWHMEGGGFADCLMVATVAAILSYAPIGIIASRIGRKKTIMGGVLLMSLCYLLIGLAGSFYFLVNIEFALIGIGWAAINVNSYPMVVEMGKGSDIGKFTGTYYTFSMAAQILTPILSGFFLEHVSYRTLFPYSFLFSTLAFFTMYLVRHGDVRPERKKSLLENFDVED